MRRLILLFLIVGLIFSAAAFGAEQWVDQTPAGFTDHLYAVHFASDVNGWAVGANGKVLKTIDGGNNWTSQVVGGAGYTWYGVSFVDSTTGYIAGASGTTPYIYKTTDGDAWVLETLGGINPNGYRCIDLSSSTVGAAGGVFEPTGGGKNISYSTAWTSTKAGTAVGTSISGINFFSTTGFAAGNYVDETDEGIYKSTNSGQTWTAQDSPANANLNDVDAISADAAWAVGNSGSIIKTTNGGTSWASQTSGTTEHLKGVNFVDANTGWAVGESGAIRKTTDGGTTWATDATGDTTTDTLEAVHAFNQYNAWAVGGGSAVILKRRVDPTITTVSPSTRYQGWTGDITLTGTNFLSDATVTVTKSGGSGFTYSAVRDSTTQITITAAIGATATTGDWTITVTNGDGGSAEFTTFAVNAAPTLASVKRYHPQDGQVEWDSQGAVRTITAEGTGFQSGATLSFSGSGVTVSATTLVSATKLQATMYIESNATVSWRDVTVTNPDTSSAIKASAFQVRTNGSGPTISTIAIAGAESASPKILTELNPQVTCNIEDLTGLSASTINFKILIYDANDNLEYLYEYPSTVFTIDPTDSTKGSVTAVLQKLEKFSTGVVGDAFTILSSSKKLYVYAEDANSNQSEALYDTVYFQGLQPT
ncbi:MAG: YCF48-related protein, partial [Candidatus Margulisiibacteriota bacterium]